MRSSDANDSDDDSDCDAFLQPPSYDEWEDSHDGGVRRNPVRSKRSNKSHNNNITDSSYGSDDDDSITEISTPGSSPSSSRSSSRRGSRSCITTMDISTAKTLSKMSHFQPKVVLDPWLCDYPPTDSKVTIGERDDDAMDVVDEVKDVTPDQTSDGSMDADRAITSTPKSSKRRRLSRTPASANSSRSSSCASGKRQTITESEVDAIMNMGLSSNSENEADDAMEVIELDDDDEDGAKEEDAKEEVEDDKVEASLIPLVVLKEMDGNVTLSGEDDDEGTEDVKEDDKIDVIGEVDEVMVDDEEKNDPLDDEDVEVISLSSDEE